MGDRREQLQGGLGGDPVLIRLGPVLLRLTPGTNWDPEAAVVKRSLNDR